jgi:hypothetical protein
MSAPQRRPSMYHVKEALHRQRSLLASSAWGRQRVRAGLMFVRINRNQPLPTWRAVRVRRLLGWWARRNG